MLEGHTYPLYKKLRAIDIDYDFYEGVHAKEGINRWCKEINGANEAKQLEKDTVAMAHAQGDRLAGGEGCGRRHEWCSDEDA